MIPLQAVAPREMIGGWTQTEPESSAWAGPESSAWAGPESSAWAGPESAAWAGPESSAWAYEVGGYAATGGASPFESGADPGVILAGVTKVLDPITGMIKWFSGGKEISQLEAQAKLEAAKAQQYMATAQLMAAKRAQPPWTMIALIGGAVAVVFLMMKK